MKIAFPLGKALPKPRASKLFFANLVADRAARLAGGLAGSLALAAAALFHGSLKRRLVDCLDVFHEIPSFISADGKIYDYSIAIP
jgi:hypothetical protein